MQSEFLLDMATIEIKLGINATVDKVWDVISDIDNEPKFWKELKKSKIFQKKETRFIERLQLHLEIKNACKKVTLEPKKRIEAKFTKGIISGEKIIEIIPNGDETIIHTTWDMKLTGVMGMFTGVIKKHIKSGTEQAMQSIKEEIEK